MSDDNNASNDRLTLVHGQGITSFRVETKIVCSLVSLMFIHILEIRMDNFDVIIMRS